MDAQLPAQSWLATAAAAESVAVVAAVAVLSAPDLAGQAAVAVAAEAAAAAAGRAAAAGLDLVQGGAGPESRQGVHGPLAGAGSQSCTVESCIFVMISACLCSYRKNLVLFPYVQSLAIGMKAAFFLISFPRCKIGKPDLPSG